MHASLFAEATVSTGFLVVAYIAIAAAALVIIAGLFGPAPGYRISEMRSEDNTSGDFLHVLECLTDSKVHTNVRLHVLTNGNNFYEEELRAIAMAKRSVNIEAYIFQRGAIAERFTDALSERARAGVKVNLLLDALGSVGTTSKYLSGFRKAGGNVAWYNDSTWNKLPRYNHRTHREVIVIDGRTAFMGGAGVADHWYRGEPRHPRWRDTMIKVEGESVPHLQATFAENWLEGCGEVLTGAEYFPATESFASEATALVVNSTPSAGGSTRARLLFQMLLASAQRSIQITTPYFLPDRSMMHELLRAIHRGVELTLLVPGKRSDHLLTRSSSRMAYGKLLKAGAAIYEYQPAMIHAKILLIDGLWGVVGSTNFDNRSFGLNDEVNLAARDWKFVERLEADFRLDVAASERITYEKWLHRPVIQRAPELLGWVFEREQ